MERILAKALGEDVGTLATQEKQLLLSRLLARLAHEIRNPLSSLDIHVQLLEEDLAKTSAPLKEKTSSRIEIIRTEIHRLENIVKQFLSLSGPAALNLDQVNVSEAVNYVCDLLRPEAAVRGIEIEVQIPQEIPPLVADLSQLTQALVNLVINAIQAIEKKGRISVKAQEDQGNNAVWIEIRDTGPGIPLEKQSHIFDPFFTTKSDGTGVGLWIVQQIVTAHGGAISAANAPDGGAVFSVRLPLGAKEAAHG